MKRPAGIAVGIAALIIGGGVFVATSSDDAPVEVAAETPPPVEDGDDDADVPEDRDQDCIDAHAVWDTGSPWTHDGHTLDLHSLDVSASTIAYGTGACEEGCAVTQLLPGEAPYGPCGVTWTDGQARACYIQWDETKGKFLAEAGSLYLLCTGDAGHLQWTTPD